VPNDPESYFDASVDPPVRGLLHRPANPSGDGVVLAHGASSNCNAPALVGLASAFAAVGVVTLRIDLPFRQKHRVGPPSPASADRDRAGLENAVAAIKTLSTRQFAGGHSYGGRQASMLAAEKPSLVSGLLLLSYPLHPPGKPDRLRTAHLGSLQAPALFVHGTSDPFGTIEELTSALNLIPTRTLLLPIDGAGHDLGFGRRSKLQVGDLPDRIVTSFRTLLAQAASGSGK
jgi:predicted alpha/beta-hydrolase family hydrolase